MQQKIAAPFCSRNDYLKHVATFKGISRSIKSTRGFTSFQVMVPDLVMPVLSAFTWPCRGRLDRRVKSEASLPIAQPIALPADHDPFRSDLLLAHCLIDHLIH